MLLLRVHRALRQLCLCRRRGRSQDTMITDHEPRRDGRGYNERPKDS